MANSKLRMLIVTTAMVPVMPLAVPAAAQDAAVDEAQEPQEYNNVIVVTARKIEETLQDVPLSVIVATGEALENANVTSIEDLSLVTPGVTFNESANSRGRGPTIRGVGTNLFGDGVEASVATYVDGVVLGRQAMGINDLIDIERVEVLRGPQSTLFGKNASAGVINIVTKAPNLNSFEFDGSVNYGHQSRDNADSLKLGATVAGPIVAGLAGFRATGYLNDRDGYLTNVNTGNSFNDKKEYGGRLKLLIEPSSDISVLLAGDYSRRDQNCCIASTTRYGSTYANDPAFDAITPGPRNTDVFIDREDAYFQDQEQWGISGEVNWDFGPVTLTSITALRKFTTDDNNEFENNPPGFGNDVLTNSAQLDQEQFSQELRLATNGSGPLKAVGGLYFFDQTVDATTGLLVRLRPGPPVPGGNDIDRTVDTQSFAVFGQIDYSLTDSLVLLLGGRYTNEDLDYSFDRRVAADGFFGFVPPLAFAGSTSDDNFSGLIGLQYFTGDNMFYATVSRGYKGQGVNVNNFVTQFEVDNGLEVVDAEIPTNYEVGARTQLFDRRLTLNATLFYTEFDDYQLSVFDPDTNSSGLRNAATLETMGLEIDFNAAVSENFSLSGGLTLLDATYKRFPNGPCFSGQGFSNGCIDVDNSGTQNTPDVQNLAGAPLQNAPDVSFNVAANYEGPISASGWNFFANTNLYFQDSVQFSVDQDPLTRGSSYTRVNASIGVKAPDDRFRISLYARNLLNEPYSLSLTSEGAADPGGQNQFLPYDYARVVGVSLGVKFR